MSLAAKIDYPATLGGMREFLRNCPSAGMCMAVGGEIDKLISEAGEAEAAPLCIHTLAQLRQRLYDRPHEPAAQRDDIFMMLADAFGGKGSPTNPLEANLRFVEELQGQLGAGEKPNFQRAYLNATRW